MSPIMIAVVLAFTTIVLSNFMSNTAAANVIIPIALTAGAASPASVVAPIALARPQRWASQFRRLRMQSHSPPDTFAPGTFWKVV